MSQSHFPFTCCLATVFLAASFASAQPPALSTDSVNPPNGSGSSQVFTFVFSDSAGYQHLGGHILINSSVSGTNSCWVLFGQTGVQLAPDNAGGAWPFVAYGSNATVQNNQCSLNGAGTTSSGSGNNMTLNLSVTFRAAYAGMKNIYTDINSSNSYVAVGTYDVTATTPDFTFSVSPSSQSVQAGQSTTYTVSAAAQSGFNQDITLSADLPQGVSGSFSPPVITGGSGSSTLTVTASSSAPAYSGSITIVGTSSSVTHTATSQLTVTGAPPPPPPTLSTDSVSPQNGNGSSQVFTFVFSDSNGYQGLGGHILINSSVSGTNSCWVLFGQSGVQLAPDDAGGAWPFIAYGSNATLQNDQCAINGAGTTVSGSGTNLSLNLSVAFRVAYAGMKNVYTDINASNSYVAVGTYDVAGTTPDFTLSIAPSSQSVQAGQSATYTVTATPLNGFNQDITLSANLPSGVSGSFNPSAIASGSGTSTLTVAASSSAPTSNGTFQVTGTSASITHYATAQLTVTGSAPPPPPTVSTVSVSPQNGSGSSQVFTFVFSDSDGYQSLGGGHIIVNSNPSGTNSCWILFGQSGVQLAPDNAGGAWPFVAYGSNATLQNDQCTVNGAQTTISGSGNNLTLNLALTFTPLYDGTKNVYTDVNSSAPNYVAMTTYTIE
jgi:hypothetical protein